MEAFQWLSKEIKQSEGKAVVMHVQHFEGVTDEQLINLFREARKEDYTVIKKQVTIVKKAIAKQKSVEKRADLQDELTRMQRQFAEIRQIDYFDSPEGGKIAAHLAEIAAALAPPVAADPTIQQVAIEDYRDRPWVTRPKPHVDRLACAWLIRHFINPAAIIRYRSKPEPSEVAFDMNEPGFTHAGNLCTFETMIRAFDLKEPGLSVLAEIVHEIDLRDKRYFHPEITGVDAILDGWLQLELPDSDLEQHGIALFQGLMSTLSGRSS